MKDQDSKRLALPVSARDHVRGPELSEISLVEYGDYECPYCRAAESIVAGLREALGDRLGVAFRSFPMRDVHPHAQHAAEVAEAAARQGRFWEMHDYLYAHQNALDVASLVSHARDLGLDAERVKHELEDHVYASRVAEDHESGLESGVIGTPTFFIDRARYDGPVTLRDMLAAIRVLHPDVETEDVASGGPRVPRVKWPRHGRGSGAE
jgi:formate-nitrite transporter family protein